MRIHLSSLGCKLNQSEMDELATRLARAGHTVVATPAEADVCILNTCAVTHVAAQKSRQALGHLHRQNPAARLVAAGCCAELSAAELARLPGVEWVAGNRDKDRLADWLGGVEGEPGSPQPAPRARTRAFVKIEDGCDNACTYCIVRVARGPQRSRPPDLVLADVRARVEAGYREIVLTGVHIGAYGRDQGAPGDAPLDLWGLAARILAETGVQRLRLSSVEPWDLPAKAFGLWADARLCRHLHLPLQSGSDAVLRRMGRRYTSGRFAALVAAARGAISGLAVTTDVIAGFPGETDAEFAASLSFVRAMGLARVHVFPYSARPGTPAARYPDQVPPDVKAARARAMRTAAVEADRAFRQEFVGQTLPVLWETCRWEDAGRVWSGLTGNYLRVLAPHPGDLANTVTPARLVGLCAGGVLGSIEAIKEGDG